MNPFSHPLVRIYFDLWCRFQVCVCLCLSLAVLFICKSLTLLIISFLLSLSLPCPSTLMLSKVITLFPPLLCPCLVTSLLVASTAYTTISTFDFCPLSHCSSTRQDCILYFKNLFLKALSHLDDLASVCQRIKNLSKTLAHVEYVIGKFCIR